MLCRRCLLLSLLHDRIDQERDIEARNKYCDTVDKVGCLAVEGAGWGRKLKDGRQTQHQQSK